MFEHYKDIHEDKTIDDIYPSNVSDHMVIGSDGKYPPYYSEFEDTCYHKYPVLTVGAYREWFKSLD